MSMQPIDPADTDTPASEAGMIAFLNAVDPRIAAAYQHGGYAGLDEHLADDPEQS